MGVGPSGESRDREEDRELGRPLGPVAQIGRGDHWCRSLGGISGLLNSHSLKFRDLTRPSLDPISDSRGRPPLLLAGGCNRDQKANDPADSGGDARESLPGKEGGAEESKVQEPGSVRRSVLNKSRRGTKNQKRRTRLYLGGHGSSTALFHGLK